jgi:CRP-like cAMP-binding protein
VLRFVGAGDVFGEIGVIDGKPRTASAVALQESEVFTVHSRDLLPPLMACPQAMLEMCRLLCAWARIQMSLSEDQTLDMRTRFARGLLRLADQLGTRRKDGIYLDLAATQEDLGNHLGLARANVSRQLGELRAIEVIKNDAGRIVIADESRLVELAEAASDE